MNSKVTSMPDIDGKTVTETENVAEHGEGTSSNAVLCIKHPTDVQFSPGTRFRLGEIEVELLHCLSLDRMVIRERQTGETRVVVRAELRLMDKAADASPQPTIKPERVSEELLAQITAREQALAAGDRYVTPAAACPRGCETVPLRNSHLQANHSCHCGPDCQTLVSPDHSLLSLSPENGRQVSVTTTSGLTVML
jgi:hypothetical protein